MIKTQIQMPDELYRAAKTLAARQEMSLAELVRRGVEYMLATYPKAVASSAEWSLPEPVELGLTVDPFADPDWRMSANMR
jgi:hypothetical protein